jgi:hypothetical protein
MIHHDKQVLDRIVEDTNNLIKENPDISQPVMQMAVHQIFKDYRRYGITQKPINHYPRATTQHDVYRC